MSQEEAGATLTAKEKKAKRSEERYKKGKKRQRDGTVKNDEPADQEAGADTAGDLSAPLDQDAHQGQATAPQTETAEKKTGAGAQEPSKKRRKKTTATPAATATAGQAGEQTGEQKSEPSKHRYIVFIGNLPYSATTQTVAAHFAAIAPTSIRHREDPVTKRSKGFAFLEFAAFDRMETCLKQYHHSEFDSGVRGEKKRRINVELTAGGGGKSEARKSKVKEKNERLGEQRKRRAEALAKEEKRKARKKAGQGGGGKEGAGAEEEKMEEATVDENAGVHPSRLRQMQGAR